MLAILRTWKRDNSTNLMEFWAGVEALLARLPYLDEFPHKPGSTADRLKCGQTIQTPHAIYQAVWAVGKGQWEPLEVFMRLKRAESKYAKKGKLKAEECRPDLSLFDAIERGDE